MEQLIGWRKFILILTALIVLAGIFVSSWNQNLLTTELVKDFLWCLFYIVIVGVGGNLIEKLIPLIPDIIKNSWFGKKEVKP